MEVSMKDFFCFRKHPLNYNEKEYLFVNFLNFLIS
jgi:hypothetical protein